MSAKSVLHPKDDTETVNAVNKAIDAAIEEGCCKIRRYGYYDVKDQDIMKDSRDNKGC